MFNRFLIGSLSTVGIVALSVPALADVGVSINGNQASIYPPPIIQAGRVFVPLRGVFEQLGASVVYDSGAINATGNGSVISLHIGSTQATVNDQPETIDVAPFIVGASTFVPLRFVSQALGATVNWDSNDRVVMIQTGNPTNQQAYQANDEDGSDSYASYAPPELPTYDQPEVPQNGDVWQPGYWAWGQSGYYWVPGTWVEPPQPNYLWTPGYWGANDNSFGWHAGFWGLVVGFYGGINYGGGYNGNGFNGGRWENNAFRYNTAVTNVNTTTINNVYVDKSVTNNYTTTRTSYVGGANGIHVQPTAEQAAIAKDHHIGLTTAQVQHVRAASQDRRLLATVNHDNPPVVAVSHPLTTTKRPEGFVPVAPEDHVKPPVAPAVAHPAPAIEHPAPAIEHPAPAVEHPAPVERTAPPERTRPVEHPAPVVHPAPAIVHPAPVVHPAPLAQPKPVYHAPVAPPHPAIVHRAPAPAPKKVPPPVHPAPHPHTDDTKDHPPS